MATIALANANAVLAVTPHHDNPNATMRISTILCSLAIIALLSGAAMAQDRCGNDHKKDHGKHHGHGHGKHHGHGHCEGHKPHHPGPALRDRLEALRDRLKDLRDKLEDRRDNREDKRDKCEDRRDARNDGDKRDKREDLRDRREDRRDRCHGVLPVPPRRR